VSDEAGHECQQLNPGYSFSANCSDALIQPFLRQPRHFEFRKQQAFKHKIREPRSQLARLHFLTRDLSIEYAYGDTRMRIFSEMVALAFMIGLCAHPLASGTVRAGDLTDIPEKVTASIGEKFAIEFNRNGDKLTKPEKTEKAEAKKLSVEVELDFTTCSPFPPPQPGATRPFLSIKNNFEKTLHVRALVRMKGSEEYVEIVEEMRPIPAEEMFYRCWDFDTQVEEVILYEFKLSDTPVP
jgi:hypothetical protein